MGWVQSISPGEHHKHIDMVTPLSVLKKKKKKKKKKRSKIVLLPEKLMEPDPETHIYLESMSPGELYKHIYVATPLSVFPKKNGTFARKINRVTGLKLWHADTT